MTSLFAGIFDIPNTTEKKKSKKRKSSSSLAAATNLFSGDSKYKRNNKSDPNILETQEESSARESSPKAESLSLSPEGTAIKRSKSERGNPRKTKKRDNKLRKTKEPIEKEASPEKFEDFQEGPDLLPRKKEVPLEATLFVGNVPLSCTKKNLKTLFRRFGKVVSVRVRSVPVKLDSKMPRRGAVITGTTNEARSSMSAYVVMESKEAAEQALSLNMTEFEGKHLRVDLAAAPASKSGAPPVAYDPERTVFLGNLHFEVETEEIVEAFTEAAAERPELGGALEAVRVVRDSGNSLCRGVGFVLFKTNAAARAALSVKGTMVHGRELRVSRVRRGVVPGGTAKGAAGRGVGRSTGVVKRKEQKKGAPELWQGLRTKGGGNRDMAKKKQQRRGTMPGREAAGSGGAVARVKGKRPSVAQRKSNQLKAKGSVHALTAKQKLGKKKARAGGR
uniref:Nucleolar protein 12 n=1 Tax=Tetraselmis sp. GSL018 TaxID=582737 RepID=A0A061SHY7_9CHLO|mmetsp:Transcript_33052/g.78397  ORF Transcript_33052/g.78397 Transcript_33052/m.78397 type:complete len:448 (+) Transcript_33052:121-1464(+)